MSEASGDSFVAEFNQHLKFCEEFDQLLSTDENERSELPLDQVFDADVLDSVKEYHLHVSRGLGVPVGLCRVTRANSD